MLWLPSKQIKERFQRAIKEKVLTWHENGTYQMWVGKKETRLLPADSMWRANLIYTYTADEIQDGGRRRPYLQSFSQYLNITLFDTSATFIREKKRVEERKEKKKKWSCLTKSMQICHSNKRRVASSIGWSILKKSTPPGKKEEGERRRRKRRVRSYRVCTFRPLF